MKRVELKTVDEIKNAVIAGERVFSGSQSYEVRRDTIGQWHIVCLANNYTIGLTWSDGATLNGSDFYYETETPETETPYTKTLRDLVHGKRALLEPTETQSRKGIGSAECIVIDVSASRAGLCFTVQLIGSPEILSVAAYRVKFA